MIQKIAADKMRAFINRGGDGDAAANFGDAANSSQWVAFRVEERNGNFTKVPINPKTGGNAMTNNPETWGTLAQAQQAVAKYNADGTGFVLADGYFGIDLDDVIDPETGIIKAYAQDIIDTMDSYTEVSLSGHGVHIIAKGEPNFPTHINGGIEMYYPSLSKDGTISNGRYLTVTGKSFGEVKPIAERTEQAKAVWETYVDGKPALGTGTVAIDGSLLTEIKESTIDYAYALSSKYGEGAASLAAEMYDAIAQAEGVTLPPAIPATTATRMELNAAIRAEYAASHNEDLFSSIVGRHVKRAGADTMLQNAVRDRAEFAWVPAGDTCAFCRILASRGWQRQSKKAAARHAEHIHSNCDCQYAVRFNSSGGPRGYDPDRYLAEYDAMPGSRKDKLNAMRRADYAENADEINAQKRAAYAKRQEAKDE